MLQADGGVTGQFRVLCDGEHDEEESEQEEDVVDAIASEEVGEPVHITPPRIEPPL